MSAAPFGFPEPAFSILCAVRPKAQALRRTTPEGYKAMGTTLQSVLDQLKGVKKNSSGFVAFCPAHDDRREQSLSVSEGGEGRVLMHCHAGCSPESITAEMGLEMRDLFPSSGNGGRNGQRKPTAVWQIRD